MSIKLVSLDNVKAFLEKTDTEHDTLLTMLIEQVSARIETFLNRKLKKQERTEYFDSGPEVFSLSAPPVDTSATLTVKLNDDAMTKGDDFYLHPDEGVIEFVTGTGVAWPRDLEVTYTGGYAEDENGILQVPDDLKRACLLQVAFDFRRREDIGLAAVSLPDGSVSTLRPAELLPEVKEILKAYRRRPL